MVTQENKDKLGYIVAYQEMLLWFMRTAREGIRRHGASLGGPSAFMDAPPQDHAIVSHVRHVLVRISGRSNRAQLELLGTHVEIIDLSLMFRYLIEFHPRPFYKIELGDVVDYKRKVGTHKHNQDDVVRQHERQAKEEQAKSRREKRERIKAQAEAT
ncbi:hypothetical protein FOXG_17051 [Fusarium oxysporum f. sp. lycopersici 4287]|uniref:Uncharacterized protein n=2 Tax=Fusarium oxysporum TaxID=5507 RepID=A0A0J9W989_FUSO4|nr:hypothetical protein FOXG_13966 [Fusarium oxysporum f. sp. lycopersici 4287]XP_018257909.1 hypothetical protein FOXG_17051 [Fusarium oxysporum f. sp. lycopersici 4287]KNB15400.1 hypothetical protein FOXG_13966 [Fusarium oxysporum f. sp. lycopersici 4287]KNB19864.1 hypothetical protein FOXG_17051 [Fusarium oxysporum f. sp. lycopersici 4287]